MEEEDWRVASRCHVVVSQQPLVVPFEQCNHRIPESDQQVDDQWMDVHRFELTMRRREGQEMMASRTRHQRHGCAPTCEIGEEGWMECCYYQTY